MAKFPNVSAKSAQRALTRRVGSPTFIQRSRQVSSEQKAIWHNITGAGRSGVIREFFDLNESDQAACRDALSASIAERLGIQE